MNCVLRVTFNVNRGGSLRRNQGLRARPPGSSARSATAPTACLCQKICWSRIFTPVARTRSGQESITYLRTDEGWLYLAVVIDLWSRAVSGWSMSPRMTAQLACDALQMALWRRKRPRNVIVHTDRGGQYCSADYQAQLKRHNLRGSMSAKGCCYDNACVESFFHSLKVECIHGEHFISREIMRATVFNYIECDYNRWRRHS
uniref:IS3 family transposase n=1 Tax=Escherichia coli TaxID=562 RepID=UPI001FED369B|nr:IS3 family transposase [Escherichia coli]